MNKIIIKTLLIISIFIISFICPVKAFAESNNKFNVKIIVDGNIKKGESIKIIIVTDKIDSIYAADICLKYDAGLLKVISFEKGEVLSDKSIEIFELENKYDNKKGTARLEFSCIGKINGFSGSGSLIIIKAQVLKDGYLTINSMPGLKEPNEIYNLKLQLINKDIKEMNFSFSPFNSKDVNENKNEGALVADKSTDKDNPKDASKGTKIENQTKTDENEANKEIELNEEVDKNSNKGSENEADKKNKQEINSKIRYIIFLIFILLAISTVYFVIRKKSNYNR